FVHLLTAGVARLGTPSMSAFPPLVGAKRTLVSDCRTSRFMRTRPNSEFVHHHGKKYWHPPEQRIASNKSTKAPAHAGALAATCEAHAYLSAVCTELKVVFSLEPR